MLARPRHIALAAALALAGWGCLGGVTTGVADALPDAPDPPGSPAAETLDAPPDPDHEVDGAPRACGTAPRALGGGRVATWQGEVQGAKEGSVWAWRGIPYAAPPLGALRWRPPEAAVCRESVLDASAFGPACVQDDPKLGVIGSEDCLTLNVWAPEGAVASPVLVFLHGGSNVHGHAGLELLGEPVYDGARLAAAGQAVVVTVQYRLGHLGNLVLPALAAESAQGVSGNYGLRDQIAALAWVQDHVAAFGGAPARVMLFGHSAGAISTCLLLTSPLARGLFSRALVLSGHCTPLSLAEHQGAATYLTQTLGCAAAEDLPACLRAVPAETLAATPFSSAKDGVDRAQNSPHVDGYVLPAEPMLALAAGEYHAMPIAFSTTTEEFSTMLGIYPGVDGVTTEAEYVAQVEAWFGVWADEVLAEYPVAAYDGPLWAYIALVSDWGFVCRTRRALRAIAEAQDAPVWRAVFSHTFGLPELEPYRAGHGVDILFGFGHLDFAGYAVPAAEQALADAMARYWSRFAATGDPNGAGDPSWPPYDGPADPFLQLEAPVVAGQGHRASQCDFWDLFE